MTAQLTAPDYDDRLFDDGQEDEYQVVRWQQGVLPCIASEHGLARLLPAKQDLPSWFKYPVNLSTGTVVAPAFHFLSERCIASGMDAGCANTLNSYAYDLRAWFEFLSLENVAWHMADQSTLANYFLDMASGVSNDLSSGDGGSSPFDEFGLARSTIKRHASTIKKMYEAAAARGETVPSLDFKVARGLGRHPEEAIRPLLPQDLKTLVSVLGPFLEVRLAGQSSRLILCSMLSLVAGPRLFEVCALPKTAFLNANPDSAQPMAERAIRIVVTKGGTPRTLMVPNWLLLRIIAYIEGERAGIVEGVGFDCAALFLNHLSAGNAAGRPLRPATLARDFRVATRKATLYRNMPGHLGGSLRSGRTHTFHDLRHTCACLHYLQNASNMGDPWLEPQYRLGHALGETTRRVYLKHVAEFGADPNRLVQTMIAEALA